MKKFVLLLFIFHFSFFVLKAQQYYLYGATSVGGKYDDGVLFRFNPFTGQDTILFNFNGADGSSPINLTYSMKSNLIYAATVKGGSHNYGTLYEYSISTGIETTLVNFTDTNGDAPNKVVIDTSGILYGTTAGGGQYAKSCIYRYTPLTNKDTAIFSFNGSDGELVYGGLFILNDTSFYGMTEESGTYHDGLIYRFNPITNKETVLYNFNGSIDGAYPQGTFIKDSDGLLYGLVAQGGSANDGTLINFSPITNQESTLVTFNGTDGKFPFGDLFLATDGLLYGMTELGGTNNGGVMFSYNVSTNRYSIVLNFDSINGKYPDGGNLIEDTVNKILYGMTRIGGKYNDGVIFSYNLNTGKDSVLLNFNGTNGANPYGTLLLVPDTLTTGVGEVRAKSEEINVYPNPSSGVFTFKSNNQQIANSQIDVYNILGQQVYSKTLHSAQDDNTINLSGQSNGIYLYRVITKTGDLVGEGKIVIQ